MIQKNHLFSIGLIAGLITLLTAFDSVVRAQNTLPGFTSGESAEPIDSCVALQEVTTGQTEIRKRIENRVITRGNWNTDFLVPAGQEFSFFVALITPEHSAPFQFNPNIRFSDGSRESLFTIRADLTRNETYSIPFQPSGNRQAAIVNARVGGVNGNFYTISIVGCP
jgi:hypothetical protein